MKPLKPMKPPSKTVVVDADALIALFNEDDAHAERAMRLLESLLTDGLRLLHPATAVAEAVTTLQRRFTNPRATAELARLVNQGHLTITPVDEAVLHAALGLFHPQGSKQNTLFDAIVAAVAKRQRAVAIFSFDHWYESQGFTLATRLYAEKAA